MEGLPRDVRTLLVRRYLRVRELRALLCVSKMYYMMFKFYVRIQTVPFGGSYTPEPCVTCHSRSYEEPIKSTTLPKRSLEHLAPKNGVLECPYGHRYLCHGKDPEDAPCPRCKGSLKKIKL